LPSKFLELKEEKGTGDCRTLLEVQLQDIHCSHIIRMIKLRIVREAGLVARM
jgi:hypothetical protein